MHSGTLILIFRSIFGSGFGRKSALFLVCAVVFALVPVLAAPASAQEHWPIGAIARFTGEDISFEGSTLGGAIPGGTSFYVSSGTVLTVHSADARLTLPGGGTVDICGPAKLTILESNTAYTLALNFGRVHVRLADTTQLHIFTPFVMATPVSIAEEARDFTLGLDLNDAMCVFAAQGAAHLEDQFSSEGLTVPQLGEFFLSGEKLDPKAGPGGTCRCFRDEAREARAQPARPAPNLAPPQAKSPAPPAATAPQPTVTAVMPSPQPVVSASATPPPSAPPANKIRPAAASKPKPPMPDARMPQLPPPAILDTLPRATSVIPTVQAAEPPPPPTETATANPPPSNPPAAPEKQVSGNAPEADSGFNVPEHANEAPPVAAHVDGDAPEAPKLEPPVRVVMPPLSFSASAPAPPVDANPQLVTLIRDARITRDWVFTGHVVDTKAPSVAATNATAAASPKATAAARRKHRGILTMFKRFFGTSAPPPQ